jgi:hypothetical protein
MGVRDVTETEVAHFHENGWAFLPGLVDKVTIDRVYATADRVWKSQDTLNHGGADNFFSAIPGDDPNSIERREVLLSPTMGRNLTRLLCIPRIRLFADAFLVKKPEAQGHGRTLYHQDFAGQAVDRSNYLSVWIALHDMPAEAGVMRFYSRSHKLGVLGWAFADGISLDDRCGDLLKDEDLSPARPMKAGDATVHHSLTVHGASANRTSNLRWARSATFIDADARQPGSAAGLPAGVAQKPAALYDDAECPIVPVCQ